MASKGQCRDIVKERSSKQSMKSHRNELPDEIALRDEIFQLKRQIMVLKKTNERNVIKVRKYEDEAKKKDRQIEELMDPVKNGDVRKLLSTKGAALLLNLKEQNNTLIQMILDKDVQIRKLLSEIKTSKLYANTRRFESYRNEIERLRNLLIKSQNLMKETQEVPQRRSICVGGTPDLEVALSTGQSPRALEELQFTIQSLEMHMKYSNELLVKKNEQITRLTNQLNSYQCSTCKKITMVDSRMNLTDYRQPGGLERESSTLSGITQATDANTYEIISPKSTILFDKNISSQQKGPQDKKRLSNSAPAGPVKNSDDFADVTRRESENQSNNYLRLPRGDSQRDENEEGDWMNGKIRLRIAKPRNQLDRFFIRDNMNYAENLRTGRRNRRISFSATDESDMETAEFELMEKKIENDQIEVESPVKLKTQTIDNRSDSSGESPVDRKEKIDDPASSGLDGVIEDSPRGCQESLTVSEQNMVPTVPELEKENLEISEGMRENTFLVQDKNEFNESDFGRRSPLLSYDSDSGTVSIHEVEVEAEINHDGTMKENSESESNEDELIIQEESSNDGDDDDDDVVIY